MGANSGDPPVLGASEVSDLAYKGARKFASVTFACGQRLQVSDGATPQTNKIIRLDGLLGFIRRSRS